MTEPDAELPEKIAGAGTVNSAIVGASAGGVIGFALGPIGLILGPVLGAVAGLLLHQAVEKERAKAKGTQPSATGEEGRR